jgi:hypothetical protein
MSFGTNNTTKTAENNLGGVSNTALNNLFPQVQAAGTSALGTGANQFGAGANTAQPAINWLNTILNGNQANTTSALQPNIDQIRQGTSATMNAANTLMPRGGGRSGTLFNQSFAPQSQIQSLFSGARNSAAQALPGIGFQQQQLGLGQQGVGTNLFGIGNQALGVGNQANTSVGQMGLQAQQMSNQLASGLGSGLFSLLTAPLGGSLLGKIPGLG